MIKKTFDMDANNETELLKLDRYTSTINESVMLIKWENVTGTLDGKVDLVGYLDANDSDSWGVIGSIIISAESGRQLIYTHLDCKAVKGVYTKNSITAGTMTIWLRGS